LSGGSGQWSLTDGAGLTFAGEVNDGVVSVKLEGAEIARYETGATIKRDSVVSDEIHGSYVGIQQEKGLLADPPPPLLPKVPRAPVVIKRTPVTCSELPILEDQSGPPHTRRASTIEEFLERTVPELPVDRVGHTLMKPSWEPKLDAKGKVAKANFKLVTKIVRPRWAPAHPPPSEKDRALSDKAVDLIKKHEEKHRDIARTAAARAICAALGLPLQQAKKALWKAWCEGLRAQEELDLHEGQFHVVYDEDSKVIDVTMLPVGKRPTYTDTPECK